MKEEDRRQGRKRPPRAEKMDPDGLKKRNGAGKGPVDPAGMTGIPSADGSRTDSGPGPSPDFGKLKTGPPGAEKDKDKKKRGRKSEEEREGERKQREWDGLLRDGAKYVNEVITTGMGGYFGAPLEIAPFQRNLLDYSLYEILKKYDWLYSQYWAEICFVGVWGAVFLSNRMIRREQIKNAGEPEPEK